MNEFIIEPPKGLLEKILKRICYEQRVLVLRQIILFSVTFIASILAFMPAWQMLVSDSNRSGFFNFFSLIFVDFSAVVASWQSFAMALLQTLPVISLALFLAVLLTFLQSIKLLTKHGKRYFSIKAV